MYSFSFVKKLLLLLSIINLSLSALCTEGGFEELKSNDLKELKVSKENEVCLKYKLKEKNTSIGLKFKLANCYTGEVVIYRSESEISMKDNVYVNPTEKYLFANNPFKEIDTSSFTDYVYIIIRDTSKYFFNDFLTLYDATETITLQEGKPLVLNKFMSNLEYNLEFTTTKNINVVFSMKTKLNLIVSLEFGEQSLTFTDNFNEDFALFSPENNKLAINVQKVKSEEEEETSELSFIVYEKSGKEVKKLNKEETIRTDYIYSADKQNFYFFSDISNYNQAGTVNLKLDFNNKATGYIKLESKIVRSDEEITNFDELVPQGNELPSGYDFESDENVKIYFKDDSQAKFKYILVKVNLVPDKYISPKYFTISIGKQVEVIDLTETRPYFAKEIPIKSNNYIPSYVKLVLNPDYQYLLTSPYQDETTLIKGDLLTPEGDINTAYLDEKEDISDISNLSELTISLSAYQFDKSLYIERIDNYTIILEGERTEDAITIKMNADNCANNINKYIVGNYNKEKYSHGSHLYTAYGFLAEGEMSLFYKNTLNLDELSLFPTSKTNQKEMDKVFLLSNNIDLFTVTCKKPGTMYIRPLKKTYDEITHFIGQNTINAITLKTQNEILQLSSPLGDKTPGVVDYAYLSVLSTTGDEITLSPLTEGLINVTTIKGNELFTQRINIDNFKMDELVIKVSSQKGAGIEVVEVIPQKYTSYEVIKDNKKKELKVNNFVRFVDKSTSKLYVNVEGLENVNVSYGIVELATNDINYLPPAYNFNENIEKKKILKKDNFEVKNNFYQKDNEKKKYKALVFSIFSSKTDFKYFVQVSENKTSKEEDDNFVMNMFLIVAIILALIIAVVTFILIRRKKGINVENIESNNANITDHPLYPSHDENALGK